MSADTPAQVRLEVPRASFLEELKRLNQVLGRKRRMDALLRHDAGNLVIRIGGAEAALPAHGHWPGEARISSDWLRSFTKVPPPHDPVVFQVTGGRMRIGGSTVTCHWQAPGAASVEVTLDMDLATINKLRLEHSEEALVQSGLRPAVLATQAEIDRRIKAAARQLAPLGVSESDVRVLVVGKLGR